MSADLVTSCYNEYIKINDSVLEGKSYYLSEAQGLLRIINRLNESTTCLVMVDEIFRGTNTKEGVAMAMETAKYLMKRNAITIVATHDVVLTNLEGVDFDKYYFQKMFLIYWSSFQLQIKKWHNTDH